MKTVLSLLSLLVFSSVCRAQDYDDIPSRFIRVACFGTVIDEAFYLDGKKRIDLDLIPGTLSFELPLPSGPNLNIFRMAPNPDPNLEAKPQLIGTIPLVKGASKQIVVLSLPEDVSKDPIRGKAFKDSNSIHPAETVRLFNLSPKEVAMRIKDEVQSYLPGESGTMPWKAQKHRATAYQVAFRNKGSEKWHIADSGERAARPNMRVFAFISEIIVEGKPTVMAQMIFDEVFNDDEDF